MLALSPSVTYVGEPFNPYAVPGLCSAPFDHIYTYVCRDNEPIYRPGLERTLRLRYDAAELLKKRRPPGVLARGAQEAARLSWGRLLRNRPLVKDPYAVFSAEWLADTFGMDVIVIVRHPAAFAASLKRRGWLRDFSAFGRDDLAYLLRDHLRGFEAELRALEWEPDLLVHAALLWRMIYRTVSRFRERHADWAILRHEDLSRSPLASFEDLYARVGLSFSQRARERVLASTSPDNPPEPTATFSLNVDSAANIWSWKRRLTEAEIDRVRMLTADVAPAFYGDADW